MNFLERLDARSENLTLAKEVPAAAVLGALAPGGPTYDLEALLNARRLFTREGETEQGEVEIQWLGTTFMFKANVPKAFVVVEEGHAVTRRISGSTPRLPSVKSPQLLWWLMRGQEGVTYRGVKDRIQE